MWELGRGAFWHMSIVLHVPAWATTLYACMGYHLVCAYGLVSCVHAWASCYLAWCLTTLECANILCATTLCASKGHCTVHVLPPCVHAWVTIIMYPASQWCLYAAENYCEVSHVRIWEMLLSSRFLPRAFILHFHIRIAYPGYDILIFQSRQWCVNNQFEIGCLLIKWVRLKRHGLVFQNVPELLLPVDQFPHPTVRWVGDPD